MKKQDENKKKYDTEMLKRLTKKEYIEWYLKNLPNNSIEEAEFSYWELHAIFD